MNKRIISILVSLVILAISVTLLLVFMLGKKNDAPDYQPSLSCIVKDLKISVGERLTNFYQTNDKNAQVYFEYDKTDIIDINENEIIGKKAGKVSITIKIANSKEEISKNFIVEVYAEGYKFKIDTLEYCDFDENSNTLIVYEENALFEIKVFDLKGNKVETLKPVCRFDNNLINISFNYGNYCIYNITGDCKVDFIFSDLDFAISLNFVCQIDSLKNLD